MQSFRQFCNRHSLFFSSSPRGFLEGADHQALVANYLRGPFLKGLHQHIIKFVLMGDQDVTMFAIAATFVEHDRVIGTNLYRERNFPSQGSLTALRTS